MTAPTWRVKAWVTAPGEFPSQSLETVDVTADDVGGALRKARSKFNRIGLFPNVVYVARTKPPASRNPDEGGGSDGSSSEATT